MSLPIGFDSSHYSVVAAMITPAFFLTATSSLLVSSNARLARVVDRMRVDLNELKRLDGPPRIDLQHKVGIHRRRSRLILRALRMLYGAITAFVATSLAIAVDSVVSFHLDLLPTALAVLGVLLVFAASLSLGREASLALTMLDQELDEQLARGRPDRRND